MRKNLILQFYIMILLLFSASIFTYGTDNVGEGGGQNQDEALTLITCSIQNDQKDVPVNSVIQLQFSKNVVNMAVAESNKKAIMLTDHEGDVVPVQVQMGDDQVDPTIKRLIKVAPESMLKQGETYILTIQNGFMSKSGTTLKEPINIRFETEAAKTKVENNSSNIDQLEKSAAELNATNGATDVTDSALNETQEPTKGMERTNHNWIYFSIACFATAIALLFVYFHRRSR